MYSSYLSALMYTLPRLKDGADSISSSNELDSTPWKAGISFVSYGVRIGIRTSEPTVLEQLKNYLPPGWEPSSSPVVDRLYSLIVGENPPSSHSSVSHQLYRQQEKLAETIEIEDIFETLDSDLRLQVGMAVQDRLFVHAGVVGWGESAIVIPGRSFSGKTTLVAALVKAGATYYSDEYAVFDSHGLVHPFPRLLSVRQGEGQRVRRCSVEELGGQSGSEALPVGLIVYAEYESGVQWCPKEISSGQAVLALLDNTIIARLRPEFALPILARAVSGAVAVEGKRGDAEEVAVALLQQLKK